jgi:hypothetical protein
MPISLRGTLRRSDPEALETRIVHGGGRRISTPLRPMRIEEAA